MSYLTPELIHPDFWKMREARIRTPNPNALIRVGPLSEKLKRRRVQWCKNQLELLKHNPSNAVLTGAKE